MCSRLPYRLNDSRKGHRDAGELHAGPCSSCKSGGYPRPNAPGRIARANQTRLDFCIYRSTRSGIQLENDVRPEVSCLSKPLASRSERRVACLCIYCGVIGFILSAL
jgi:hypothetical protein